MLAAAGHPAAVVWLQFKYPENSVGFHTSAQADGSTAVIALCWALYGWSCTSFSSPLMFTFQTRLDNSQGASFTILKPHLGQLHGVATLTKQ